MALRPCASCGRHHGDEERCPHCGSDAWRAPVLPDSVGDPDLRVSAPKYGGPPLRRHGLLLVLLTGLFAALGALARWLARRP
jgi:hypothetical protein